MKWEDEEEAHRRDLRNGNIQFTLTSTFAILVAALISNKLGRLNDLALWGSGIGLPLAALFAGFVLTKRGNRTPLYVRCHLAYSGVVAALLIAAVVCTALFGALAGMTYIGAKAFHWIERAEMGGRPLWIMLAALTTGLVGGAFFYFRLRQRFVYGATEALAGVAIAAHRTSIEPLTGIPSETGFYLAVLTAGVYLVVRGLDNMHQAYKDGAPFTRYVRRMLGDTSLDRAFADRRR